jgi:hypothetical protein
MRRLFAILAALALSLGYLSAETPSYAAASVCCASGLCPMHRMMQTQGASCDTDMSHGMQLQACPSHSQRYGALPDFVSVAPPTVAAAEPIVETVAPFAFPIVAAVTREVAAPPPRTTLA